MNAAEVQEKYRLSSSFFEQEKYVEALTTIEQLEPLLPNSLGLALLRARTVAALGRNDEAEAACRQVARRLAEARREANAMRHSLGDEYGQLKRLLDEQEREYQTLNEAVQEVLAKSHKSAAPPKKSQDAAPLQQELLEVRAQLRERERALRDAEGRLNDQDQALKNLRSEVAAWQQRLEEAAASHGGHTKELEKWRLAAEDATAQLDRMKRSLNERQTELDDVRKRAQEREADLAELHKQLGASEAKVEHAVQKEKRLSEEVEAIAARESEKAQRLKHMEDEAQALRQELAQRDNALQKIATQHEQAQQRGGDLQAALEASRKEAEQTAANAAQIENRLRAEHKQTTDALEQTRQEAARLQKALEEQAAKQREQHASLQRAAQAAEAQAHELNGRLAAREKDVRAAEEARARQEKLAEDLRAELAGVQAHSVEAADSLSEKMDALRAETDAARTAMDEAAKRAETLQQALQERDASLKALQNEYAAHQQAYDKLLKEEKQAAALASAGESKQEHLHQALAEKEHLLAAAAQREHALASELEQLRASLSSGTADEEALNAELERLRQAETAHAAALTQFREDLAKAEKAHTLALTSLQAEVDAARAQGQATSDVEARLQRQEEAYRLQTTDLAAAQQEIETLRAQAQEQRAGSDDVEALQAELAAAHATQEKLKAELQPLAALRDASEQQKTALAAVHSELERTRKALAEQSNNANAASAKEVAALRDTLTKAEAANKDLSHKLALTEDEDKVRGRALDQAHEEMDRLRQSLSKAAKNGKSTRSSKGLIAAAFFGALVGAGGLLAGVVTGVIPTSLPKAAVASVPAPMVVTFPSASIGELFQRPAGDETAQWTALQPASGTVEVASDNALQLRAASVAAALEALPSLPPQTLTSLWLPQAPSSAQWDLVKGQHALREVRVMAGYVDQAAAAALQKALPDVELHVDYEVRFAELMRAPQARTVSFGGQNLGKVYVRPWDSNDESAWTLKGNALGDVAVPAATALKLDADYDQAKDLGALAQLDPVALQALRLKGKHITDDGLVHIKNLHGLQTLEIVGTTVTDVGLRQLTGLLALRHLNLNGADIGDAATALMAQFQKLETLDLAGTHITNASVESLKRLKNLQQLNIANTNISQEGSLMLSYDLSAEVKH